MQDRKFSDCLSFNKRKSSIVVRMIQAQALNSSHTLLGSKCSCNAQSVNDNVRLDTIGRQHCSSKDNTSEEKGSTIALECIYSRAGVSNSGPRGATILLFFPTSLALTAAD